MNVGGPSASPPMVTDTSSSAVEVEDDCPELDCPWFDPRWLLDHPDFPLAAAVTKRAGEDRGDSQWRDIARTSVTARSA